MEIYFDESGNSGCVLLKNEVLNFDKQPVFAIGSVICDEDSDKEKLICKYKRFKEKFNIAGEIKGTELTTRKYNDALEYLMRYVFDNTHFQVNLYDKRFYISTLLLLALLGQEFQVSETVLFYQQASMLALQTDEFFVKYCTYISAPSEKNFHEYLLFLKNYDYKYISSDMNAVKTTAGLILKDHNEPYFYDDFITFGWYKKSNITNLINLNALSEMIHFIKYGTDNNNQNIVFTHDRIKEFEDTIVDELKSYNIAINFADSKSNDLLQLADNLASIVCHAFVKMQSHFKNKKEWALQSEWDLQLFSRLLNVVEGNNIKFTVPVQDWTTAICVKKMFGRSYPKNMRKNLYFNIMYQETMSKIYYNLQELSPQIKHAEDVLKK